jgi:hypothetical protein
LNGESAKENNERTVEELYWLPISNLDLHLQVPTAMCPIVYVNDVQQIKDIQLQYQSFLLPVLCPTLTIKQYPGIFLFNLLHQICEIIYLLK